MKKLANETKTERELSVQYKDKEIDGKLACRKRIYNMDQTRLKKQIKELQDNIEIEKLVSKKIQDFIANKKEQVDGDDKIRNDLKEEKIKLYQADKEKIDDNRVLAEQKGQEYMKLVDDETKHRQKQDEIDLKNQESEQSKVQEKLDMQRAATYVQNKWNWW
jgi:hypothetical protein